MGANGDTNGPQRGPGFQELPTMPRSMVTPRQALATHRNWPAGYRVFLFHTWRLGFCRWALACWEGIGGRNEEEARNRPKSGQLEGEDRLWVGVGLGVGRRGREKHRQGGDHWGRWRPRVAMPLWQVPRTMLHKIIKTWHQWIYTTFQWFLEAQKLGTLPHVGTGVR